MVHLVLHELDLRLVPPTLALGNPTLVSLLLLMYKSDLPF